jgi:nicotinate-nucleotide--dimethylbenzimidazole phosphoribosyltransferase
MVRNFANGGAAVNVLSHYVSANFEVIDVGLLKAIKHHKVIVERAGNGTANLVTQAAMTEAQLQAALSTGRHVVNRAIKHIANCLLAVKWGLPIPPVPLPWQWL